MRAAVDPDGGRDRAHRPGLRGAVELLVVAAPAGVLREPDLGEDLALADRRGEVVRRRTRPPAPCGCRPARRSPARRPARAPTAPRSPAGSACASEPPSVPRWRTWLSATVSVAWASSVTCCWTRLVADDVVVRRSSPRSTIRSPSSRMPRSSAMPPRSMSTDGAASRSRSTGSRLCPPARILASSPPSASACDRLGDRRRLDVVELGRDHCDLLLCGLFGSIEPRPAPGEWVSTGVSWVARPLASWMARHTRCEVVGISTVGDAEVAQRVDHAVHDGRGGGDGAGLADALDPQRVGRGRGAHRGRCRSSGRSAAEGSV